MTFGEINRLKCSELLRDLTVSQTPQCKKNRYFLSFRKERKKQRERNRVQHVFDFNSRNGNENPLT